MTKQQVEDWLKYAERDLQLAEDLLEGSISKDIPWIKQQLNQH